MEGQEDTKQFFFYITTVLSITCSKQPKVNVLLMPKVGVLCTCVQLDQYTTQQHRKIVM